MRKNVLGHSSLEAYESQNDQNSYFGPVSNETHCVAGSTPATSCQWLLTLQQCGSFVGKRLLGEVLFTAFNEDAASTATNKRSSQFLSVTQRLHQTTKTADRAHGTNRATNRETHSCSLTWVTKALFKSLLPLRSLPRIQRASSALNPELLVHSRLPNLFTIKDALQFLLDPLWHL